MPIGDMTGIIVTIIGASAILFFVALVTRERDRQKESARKALHSLAAKLRDFKRDLEENPQSEVAEHVYQRALIVFAECSHTMWAKAHVVTLEQHVWIEAQCESEIEVLDSVQFRSTKAGIV